MFSGKITINEAKQSNLLNVILNFNNKVKPRTKAGKEKISNAYESLNAIFEDWELNPLRLWNTGLMPSGASLTSWEQGASLTLVGHLSSDGVTIKMPYVVDALHRPASHPIFSYWVG